VCLPKSPGSRIKSCTRHMSAKNRNGLAANPAIPQMPPKALKAQIERKEDEIIEQVFSFKEDMAGQKECKSAAQRDRKIGPALKGSGALQDAQP